MSTKSPQAPLPVELPEHRACCCCLTSHVPLCVLRRRASPSPRTRSSACQRTRCGACRLTRFCMGPRLARIPRPSRSSHAGPPKTAEASLAFSTHLAATRPRRRFPKGASPRPHPPPSGSHHRLCALSWLPRSRAARAYDSVHAQLRKADDPFVFTYARSSLKRAARTVSDRAPRKAWKLDT
jgi:hypothetical protein